MFTPPPSPFPSPKDGSSNGSSQGKDTTAKKSRFGRRTKWTAILIPFALVLTTASTHYFTHPVAFDFFLTQPEKVEWDSIGTLHKRHPDSNSALIADTSLSTTPTPTSSASASTSATTTLAATAQAIPTIPSTTPSLPTPFPQPWDSDISQNFSTENCYTYIQAMLNNQTFRSCRPFSLLLSTSNDFFEAEGNLTLMNEIVWGTCNPTLGLDQCVSNMEGFASGLKDSCKEDLSDENETAVQTLIGLQVYSVMSTTGCLSDPSTNTYCFLNAIHNTNPSDVYYYQMPLGISVPSTSTPTCSVCTKDLMGVYLGALQNSSSSSTETDASTSSGTETSTSGNLGMSALASVYTNAEEMAVGTCGEGYAQSVTSALASSSNGGRRMRRVAVGGWAGTASLSVPLAVVVGLTLGAGMGVELR